MSLADYEALFRHLHTLTLAGAGESQQAEALAEQLDWLWQALTSQEQDQMRQRVKTILQQSSDHACHLPPFQSA